MAKFDARDALLSTHRQRNLDRSAVGMWIGTLDDAGRSRFAEYVEALPDLRGQISVPTFADAVKRDDLLGEHWPKLSSESLKKWLSRTRPDGDESTG